MAKRNAPVISPEGRAAHTAGEMRREKERKARERNAEKQKRYRDGKKGEGYRRVTLWEKPGPADKRMAGLGFRQTPSWEKPSREGRERTGEVKVKVSKAILETSIGAAARYPRVKQALDRAAEEFISVMGEIPEGEGIYKDYLELVKVIGEPLGEG